MPVLMPSGKLLRLSIDIASGNVAAKCLVGYNAGIQQPRPSRRNTFENIQVLKNLLVQLSDQSSDAVESQTIEIKSWCHDDRQLAEKVAEAAACLANTDGGIVLVGIDDKRNGRDK